MVYCGKWPSYSPSTVLSMGLKQSKTVFLNLGNLKVGGLQFWNLKATHFQVAKVEEH